MMDVRSLRRWYQVHKWTSLVCTVFLLMLCITGLPLIFGHEIEHLLGRGVEVEEMPGVAADADLETMAAKVRAQRPDKPIRFLSWDDDYPVAYFTASPAIDSPAKDIDLFAFDTRTGEQVDIARFDEGLIWFLFKLHVDLFMDLPGTLFLGFMGILFVVAIVSGVVVYGPFMRRLDFGTLRTDRSTRLKWLDLHNLLGIVTLAWALVVGFTGVINTLAEPILMLWQRDQLAGMVAPYKDLPPLSQTGPVAAAIATAKQAAPGMTPSFVAYPGTLFSSNHHYAVFMHGATPLSQRLLKPALVDAKTGELTAMRSLPWYVTALLVCQPLHFGDYGGMPLKVVWGVLTSITIVVLGSGVYLWLGRRRSPIEIRLRELEEGGLDTAMARGAGEAS